MSDDITKAMGVGFMITFTIIGLSALFALPVMYLWNNLLPVIFGVSKVTFLQAWGLLILSSIMFKSNK